jgi:hypothetical protein
LEKAFGKAGELQRLQQLKIRPESQSNSHQIEARKFSITVD